MYISSKNKPKQLFYASFLLIKKLYAMKQYHAVQPSLQVPSNYQL